ncbi:MAG: DNL zinc finger-domain-containing protein [Monoraphidium minutum]|nr:MAG: DNL zinc finger-domain-containing protein [Monoraphidium minutum]
MRRLGLLGLAQRVLGGAGCSSDGRIASYAASPRLVLAARRSASGRRGAVDCAVPLLLAGQPLPQPQLPRHHLQPWPVACGVAAWRRALSTGSGGDRGDGGGDGGGEPLGGAAHPRDKNMAMVFTCKKCDTRAAKAFSRHSYENGIVIVRCPGCQSMHLVADNLGWFEHGEKGFRIEDFLRSRGERVLRVREGQGGGGGGGGGGAAAAAELSSGDVAGWSRVQQLINATGPAGGGGSGGDSGGGGGGGDEQRALAPGEGGVLSVEPADLDAWARVAGSGGGSGGGGGEGKR